MKFLLWGLLLIGPNWASAQLTVGDFYSVNKATIIDFWASWCGSCYSKFPLLDSVQKEYPDAINVMLVTEENIVRPLRYNFLKTLVGDTILKKLFPHIYLPHYVWIGADGIIKAITGTDEITRQHVENFINGGFVSANIKVDDTLFDGQVPLYVKGNGGNGEGIIFRSTFSRAIAGLPAGNYIKKDSNQGVVHIIQTNKPDWALVTRSSGWFGKEKRIVFQDVEKKDNPFFCYELIVPSGQDAYGLMREDLFKYTGLRGRIDTTFLPCYVLILNGKSKFKTKGGISFNRLYETDGRELQNRDMENLRGYLDDVFDLPVVDETGFTGGVDIRFPDGANYSVEFFQKHLAPYGLKLMLGVRRLPQFIIYHH